MGRLVGLTELLQDAVEHGASAVERVHRSVASRPFDVLGAVPIISGPLRGVRLVHDAFTAGVYSSIRVASRLAGALVGELLEPSKARTAKRE